MINSDESRPPVKLIASDLDGTLLDAAKRLPQQIFPLIDRLSDAGILFAPASGRQYANLKKLFAPVADKVLFLCENGALVKYREKTLYLNALNDKKIESALDVIRALDGLFPVLCGVNCAYVENDGEPFTSLTFAAYTACKRVGNLNDVIGREPICKISVFDAVSAAENGMKTLPQRLRDFRVMQSGYEWCDVSAPDCNKGRALEYVCNELSLEKKACVGFGDHMNDYEMLLACGEAYVPENAFPLLKERIGNVIPSNQAGGVIVKLEEILSRIEGEPL